MRAHQRDGPILHGARQLANPVGNILDGQPRERDDAESVRNGIPIAVEVKAAPVVAGA